MDKKEVMETLEKMKADKEVRKQGFWAMLSKYGQIPTMAYAVACAVKDAGLSLLYGRDPRATVGLERNVCFYMEMPAKDLLLRCPKEVDLEVGYLLAIGDQKAAERLASEAEAGVAAARAMTVNLCAEEGVVILPGRPIFEGDAIFEFVLSKEEFEIISQGWEDPKIAEIVSLETILEFNQRRRKEDKEA